MQAADIATAEEVMQYLTRVMRGEEKDQFDIDASIADRTAAAKELNRRFKEIEDTTKTSRQYFEKLSVFTDDMGN